MRNWSLTRLTSLLGIGALGALGLSLSFSVGASSSYAQPPVPTQQACKNRPLLPNGQEDVFFLNLTTPPVGSSIGPGGSVGAWYSDESLPYDPSSPTDRNRIVFTLAGPGGLQNLPVDTSQRIDYSGGANKWTIVECWHQVNVRSVIPNVTTPGTYTVFLRVFDTDNNEPGHDFGTASWTFVVTQASPSPVTSPSTSPSSSPSTSPSSSPSSSPSTSPSSSPSTSPSTSPSSSPSTSPSSSPSSSPSTSPSSSPSTSPSSSPSTSPSSSPSTSPSTSPSASPSSAPSPSPNSSPPVQSDGRLGVVIDLCGADGNPTTTAAPAGGIAFVQPLSDKGIAPSNAVPVTLSEAPGWYRVTATPPNGYGFIACSRQPVPPTPGLVTVTANVAVDGFQHVVFYVSANHGTLNALIDTCSPTGVDSGPAPTGGRASVPGTSASAPTATPLALSVAPGTYIVTAKPPAGYHFVSCGGGARPDPSSATAQLTVAPDGTATATFMVQADPAGGVLGTGTASDAVLGTSANPNTGRGYLFQEAMGALSLILAGVVLVLLSLKRAGTSSKSH